LGRAEGTKKRVSHCILKTRQVNVTWTTPQSRNSREREREREYCTSIGKGRLQKSFNGFKIQRSRQAIEEIAIVIAPLLFGKFFLLLILAAKQTLEAAKIIFRERDIEGDYIFEFGHDLEISWAIFGAFDIGTKSPFSFMGFSS